MLTLYISQTPLKFHADIWCRWLFRNLEKSVDSIEVNFDIGCCQGFVFGDSESDIAGEHFPVKVSMTNIACRRISSIMAVKSNDEVALGVYGRNDRWKKNWKAGDHEGTNWK